MSFCARVLFATGFLLAMPVPAFAEDTQASRPGVYQSPVIVVYGRPNRPNVQIVVKPPTAATAAAAAHESLRAALWAPSEPVAR